MAEHILLVGNGINDAQTISWKKMLDYVQTKLIESGKTAEEKRIDVLNCSFSATLLYESIRKNSCAEEPEVRDIVKNYVEDKSNFVRKIWSLYDTVLTTNFDNNLVINGKSTAEDSENPKNKKLIYLDSFTKRRLDFQYQNKQKSIFFIHGYYRHPETICLGFDQYSDNLKRIEDYVGNMFSKKKKKSSQKYSSWIDYFFKDNTVLDILGLSMCSDEIDLWWLLNYRAKIFSQLKENKIRYFDLYQENKTDKRKILESLNVEIEEIKNVDSYDSDFYSLCMKKIKEDCK